MHSFLNNIENRWPKKLADVNYKIIIDADSSPVIDETVHIALRHHIEVILVKDYAHYSSKIYGSDVRSIYVDTSSDSADYKILSLVDKGDIVITGDYGLASIVINKALVMHHTGFIYTKSNLDALLITRYINHESRKMNKRIKGPAKFTTSDRMKFKTTLEQIITSPNY
ncbi:YaiI/YqxD family protein [Macrococcoides caseolyticum]|nr:YaiI/YqxD family protein [Macrococcus caseolyticus]